MVNNVPGIQIPEIQQQQTGAAAVQPAKAPNSIHSAQEKLTPEKLCEQLGINEAKYLELKSKIPNFDINNKDNVRELRKLAIEGKSEPEKQAYFEEQRQIRFAQRNAEAEKNLSPEQLALCKKLNIQPFDFKHLTAKITDFDINNPEHLTQLEKLKQEHATSVNSERGFHGLNSALAEGLAKEMELFKQQYPEAYARWQETQKALEDPTINPETGKTALETFQENLLEDLKDPEFKNNFIKETSGKFTPKSGVAFDDLSPEEQQKELDRWEINLNIYMNNAPAEYKEAALAALAAEYPKLAETDAFKLHQASVEIAKGNRRAAAELLGVPFGRQARRPEENPPPQNISTNSALQHIVAYMGNDKEGEALTDELLNIVRNGDNQLYNNTAITLTTGFSEERQVAAINYTLEHGSKTALEVTALRTGEFKDEVQLYANEQLTSYATKNNDAALLDAVAKGVSKYAEQNQTQAFNNVLNALKAQGFSDEQISQVKTTLADQIAQMAPQTQLAAHEAIVKSASASVQQAAAGNITTQYNSNKEGGLAQLGYAFDNQAPALIASYNAALQAGNTELAEELAKHITFNASAREQVLANPDTAQALQASMSEFQDSTLRTLFDNKTEGYSVGDTKPDLNNMTKEKFQQLSAKEQDDVLTAMVTASPQRALELAFAVGQEEKYLPKIEVGKIFLNLPVTMQERVLTYMLSSNNENLQNMAAEIVGKHYENREESPLYAKAQEVAQGMDEKTRFAYGLDERIA
jgi:hypothetical protein